MADRMAEPEDRSAELPGLNIPSAPAGTRRRQWPASRTYWILLILFVELQIADILTTNHALALPGVWELNPLMAMSQAKFGAAWWVPKLTVVAFTRPVPVNVTFRVCPTVPLFGETLARVGATAVVE